MNALMNVGNDLSARGNEDLGFLCNSLANKASLCLMNFRGLAGSGSVVNEAKQFSKSTAGQWWEKSAVCPGKLKPNLVAPVSIESMQIEWYNFSFLSKIGTLYVFINSKYFRLIFSTLQSFDWCKPY